jgi:tetratricopeptide (TPR) repeat protein
VALDVAATLRNAERILRTGQADEAVALYRQAADHLFAEGFYPKAAAIVKKILRVRPEDDAALVRLGDIAVRQGLITEARGHYTTVAARRSERGDLAGATAIAATLGGLETTVALPLIADDLRSGRAEAAQSRMMSVFALGAAGRSSVADLVEQLAREHPEAAAACAEAVADAAIADGDGAQAVAVLRCVTRRVPGSIPILLRLIELGSDTGLDEVVCEAQGGLADAYLAGGRPHEARIIAEDLVTRDRSDPGHVARLRRSLEMLAVEDVDRLIAERVNATILDPLDFLAGELTVSPSVPVLPGTPAAHSASADDVIAATGALDVATAEMPADPGPPPAELEELFAGLRAEADADPLVDGGEAYIALARSSIERGAIEEAIDALLQAVRSPKRRFRCAALLAQLYRDLGDIPKAIEWYERGAEAPPASAEDGARLMYDLGDLLETMGENARALAIFIEVDAEAPGFLDVPARIARLSPDQAGG